MAQNEQTTEEHSIRPLNTARGSGERCKLPRGVWGKTPTEKRFGAYWSQKVQLWWQQFLLIFLRTNVIICTKTVKLRTEIATGSDSSQGGGAP